jgi:hypothetical protein
MPQAAIIVAALIAAILIGAIVSFGRGPNRCAVKPRREP